MAKKVNSGNAPLTAKKRQGRPPKDKYNISYMCAKIDEYIEKNKEDLLILKECCLLNDWCYDYVMQLQRDNESLSQSIKKLLAQKEIILEKGLLTGKLNTTGAIFVLKQPAHGWTDKQVEQTEKTDPVTVVNDLDD